MSGYVDLKQNIKDFNYLISTYFNIKLETDNITLFQSFLEKYNYYKKKIIDKRKLFKIYRDELDKCYDYIKVQLLDLYSEEKIDHLEDLLDKNVGIINSFQFYLKTLKRSTLIIERNWIKCRYDPDYLLCKTILKRNYMNIIL